MNKVYIGLGTNLGDRGMNLSSAYEKIESRIGKVLKKSGYYKTPPWGFESDQDFINTVILVETDFELTPLLDALKQIENESGRIQRKEGEGYKDRVIDLDILDFNQCVFSSEKITVPHDKMHLRNFVIFPLAEIAPNWVHPVLKKSAQILLKNVPNQPPIENLS